MCICLFYIHWTTDQDQKIHKKTSGGTCK
uniref:Uncharacterized protein n=1 Tax=Rhizophora mucronata TaxID=61149 RepID=A0A2P2P9Q4_RHIMU